MLKRYEPLESLMMEVDNGRFVRLEDVMKVIIVACEKALKEDTKFPATEFVKTITENLL